MSEALLVAVGGVLLVAGALKLYAMMTGQSAAAYWPILEPLLELTLAFWCIGGIAQRWAWFAVVCLFIVFCAVSLTRALGGHHSCGCFGSVRVNPWYTLGLDLAVLIGLVLWHPRKPVPRASKGRLAFTAILLLVSLGVGGWVLAVNRPAWLHANGQITGGGGTLYMQPVAWTNHRLPLLRYMPRNHGYAHGQWLIILYHHSCQLCWQAIRQVESKLAAAKRPHRVLLVQIPPEGNLPPTVVVHGMELGKVNFHRRWAIPMFPLYVDVSNGRVTRVRVYAKGYWSGF